MKVDAHTMYEDFSVFEPCIDDAQRRKLMDASARDLYGDGGWWLMPLGDLFAIYDGDTSPLKKGGGKTVFDVYRVIGLSEWMERYIATLEGLTLRPTAKEAALQNGTTRTTFENAVRVFCRDWFGLPNYKCVDDLTVTDFLIAKEAAYNRAVIDRNISNQLKVKGSRK